MCVRVYVLAEGYTVVIREECLSLWTQTPTDWIGRKIDSLKVNFATKSFGAHVSHSK